MRLDFLRVALLVFFALCLPFVGGCAALDPDGTTLAASDFAAAPFVLDRHDAFVRGDLLASELSDFQVEQMLKTTAKLRDLLLTAAAAEGVPDSPGGLIAQLEAGLDPGGGGPDASLGGDK